MTEQTPEDRLAALEASLAAQAESVRKLEANNAQLRDELSAARARAREAEEAQAAAAEEARAKAEEVAAKSGDLDSLRATLEQRHKAEMEKINKRAAEAEGALNRYIVDGGVRDALAAAEIAPAFSKGAALQFKEGRNIEIKDGAAFVDGVPIADAVKEWAASEGAVYKAAGQANGGGAPGGAGKAGSTLADLSEADRLKLARENPGKFQEMRKAG